MTERSICLGALALACSVEPADVAPRVSLTCDFAEFKVIEVGTFEDPRACYLISTDQDWRVAPLNDNSCPDEGDRCVHGRQGETFIIYRSQTTITQQGGWVEHWADCDDPCDL